MSEETYVCCGAPIPEGRQVCPKCEKESKNKKSPTVIRGALK